MALGRKCVCKAFEFHIEERREANVFLNLQRNLPSFVRSLQNLTKDCKKKFSISQGEILFKSVKIIKEKKVLYSSNFKGDELN